jgi:hypothetical protein
VHVLGAETAAEIAGRGRIGNAWRSQSIEVDLVLAAQLEVLLFRLSRIWKIAPVGLA